MNKLCWSLLTLGLVVTVGPSIRADADDAGVRVYRNTLKSTVWVHSNRENGVAQGTGSLIDRRRQLILTNYHVVGDVDRAMVFFPAYRDGRPVAEKSYYKQRERELGIRGRVVARDKRADLALIQIERVPDGAQALSLAPAPVQPGQTVHSLGNPGKSDALWVYTPGRVRQVYHKKWRAKIEDRIVNFEAQVVETDSPTNPGDSGGPLVNDRGELVAVTEGGALDAQLLSTFIDVSEVQRLLNTPEVRGVPVIGADRERKSGAGIVDDAHFFSPDAIKRAQQDLDLIAHRFGRDLRIETFANPPEADKDRLRSANGEERAGYFRSWAQKRARAAGVNGVTILICRDPSYLYVNVAEDARSVITADEEKRLRETLLSKFREKKYDEGLDATIHQVREALADQRP
jgi:S1-C subfamily serine protease